MELILSNLYQAHYLMYLYYLNFFQFLENIKILDSIYIVDLSRYSNCTCPFSSITIREIILVSFKKSKEVRGLISVSSQIGVTETGFIIPNKIAIKNWTNIWNNSSQNIGHESKGQWSLSKIWETNETSIIIPQFIIWNFFPSCRMERGIQEAEVVRLLGFTKGCWNLGSSHPP